MTDDGIEFSRTQALIAPLAQSVQAVLMPDGAREPYFNVELDGSVTNEAQKFFVAAFAERTRKYLPILLVVLILFGLELSGKILLVGNGQVYGLILDMTGAVVLTLGLFRSPKQIQRDTKSETYGATLGGGISYDSGSLSSEVQKTVDGFYGALFLVIGFTLQILSMI